MTICIILGLLACTGSAIYWLVDLNYFQEKVEAIENLLESFE